MKNIILAFVFANSLLCANKVLGLKKKDINALSFTENKGQVHDQHYKARPDVLFSGTDGKLVFHLKNNGISYQLNRVDSWKEEEDHKTKEKRQVVDKSTIYRVDINWLNANTQAAVKTGNALEGYNNYYLETCPNGALNVKSYEQVEYENIYTGINLKWYKNDGQLKYDYIVAPHANYKQIQLQINGAQLQLQKNGSLLLKTPLGNIEEHAPIVYQNGKKLKANYVLKGNVLSFNVEKYDPSQQLIIDPVVRLWGTYYGDGNSDSGRSCTTDDAGNVYMAGSTSSNTGTVIATTGAHQSVFGGGFNDAFLVKFNASGVRQWGTYYGGGGYDYGYSCTTDPSGNVYMAGSTSSNTGTVIATAGAHQSVSDGSIDAFLVKFNASGVRQWGTYYGGGGNENGYSCATDASGNVYLAGDTQSNTSTLIATAGAHQSVSDGSFDAFLVKFNASGVRQWGTYYGGSSSDEGYSCSTDPSGNVYLAGYTQSNTGTVIATVGAHQSVSDGSFDAFLVKFNASGVRQWGTYYGDSAIDKGYSCTTDAAGNIYLTGYTSSNAGTVIATAGAHQSVFGGGSYDAFLVKFNASGVRQWGTYYGGSASDEGYSCATDASGNVYLAGRTQSNTGTVITTALAYQSVFGGSADAFLVKFNAGGARQWGTYYGGSGIDYGNSLANDAAGNVYLTGFTNSFTGAVIATAVAHQSVFGGGSYDAFLVKLTDCVNLSPTATVNGSLCTGASISFTASITGTATPTYSWVGPNSYTSGLQNPVIASAGTVNIGTYTLTVKDNGCVQSATTQVSAVNANPSITAVTSNTNYICVGQSATLTASGALTYTFNPGGNVSSIVVSPSVTTNYTVTGTDANGCSNTAVITQSVDACAGIQNFSSNTSANVLIYPNPSTGKFILHVPENGSISVYNSAGLLIYNNNTASGNSILNLELYSNGVYFIQFNSSNYFYSQKIIKQ